MNYRIITGVILAISVVIGSIFAIQYFSRPTLTVNFSNAEDVMVVYKEGAGEAMTVVDEISIAESGQHIRIHGFNPDENQDIPTYYSVAYSGAEGYADGEVTVNPGDTTITIDPDYSQSKYSELSEKARPKVVKILSDTYPEFSKYSIGKDIMVNKGTWYGLSLRYTASDKQTNLNSDTLRVVFKNDNGVWVEATKPQITLSQSEYSDVPKSVLNAVNALN